MSFRLRPLRLRTFAAFHPLRVGDGYTNEFYSLVHASGLRPYRLFRSTIKPLFREFVLDRFEEDDGFFIYFFELPPGVEPVPLPEDLERLKRFSDELLFAMRGVEG